MSKSEGSTSGDADEETAKLVTLTTSVAAMKRLLGRLDAGGTLVPADADLMKHAIDAVRSEVSSIGIWLNAFERTTDEAERATIVTLRSTLIVVSSLIDTLEGSLRRLNSYPI